MSFSDDLLAHAWRLSSLALDEEEQMKKVIVRRAVSTAYYALFHHINSDAVDLLAPNVSLATNHRIQRWFDHAEMKKICGRFLPDQLDHPLLDLIGNTASADMRILARSFIQLQDARHLADYDLSYILSWEDSFGLLDRASKAIEAWDRIAKSAEANIFILSLLMWKNWEKER